MKTTRISNIFAAVFSVSAIVMATPAQAAQNPASQLTVPAASRLSVSTSGINSGLSGKYTESFLQTIRSGSNKLYFNGDYENAGYSLSEIVSIYCSLKSGIDYYEVEDSTGCYLEITGSYWNTLYNAVKTADQGWNSYKAEVANALYSLNLDASTVSVVDQINEYICRNYNYKVTNAGMPYFIQTGYGQCWHYAKMFADMCNAAGIPCRKVENSEHAWNEVTVNGTTYVFDVTYNDTGGNWEAYSWLINGSKSRPSSGSSSSASSSAVSSSAVSSSYVKNAWVQSGKTWYYMNSKGEKVRNAWVKDGKDWYYMGSTGAMLTSTWLESNGKWYYLKSNGKMAVSTWIDGCWINQNGVWAA